MGVRLPRSLLLCALTLAVLGMHHLALAPHSTGTACHSAGAPTPPMSGVDAPDPLASGVHGPGAVRPAALRPTARGSATLGAGVLLEPSSASSASSADGPASGHDMLHLCLAVLSAVSWLFLVASLLAAVGGTKRPATGLRLRMVWAWRPRRPSGRSLLASVCVLRI
jgi:hypothetical protein